MKKILIFIFLFVLYSSSSKAESNYIDCNLSGCNQKYKKTRTVFYKGKNDKITLIWLQGGDGQTQGTPRTFENKIKGKINLVIVDNPYKFGPPWKQSWPKMQGKDQSSRLKTVVQFYKSKTNSKIWLGGISSGCPRISGFLRNDKENQNLISGAIFASCFTGPNGSDMIKPYVDNDLPILIAHHQKDLCPTSHTRHSSSLYKNLLKKNKGKTEFFNPDGTGSKNSTTTCGGNGHHNFQGSEKEVSEAILKFIKENTK